MTLPTLHWFRWSAMVTVFVGFWYWSQIYVAADARRMGVNPGSTIGLFLLIWIATWGILYFVISRAPSGYLLGAVTAVAVSAAAWLFVNYTPVGQDDNHVLSIGIGGGFGIIMLFNVWGIIWRNNKKIIRGNLAGAAPAEAAPPARQFALHDPRAVRALICITLAHAAVRGILLGPAPCRQSLSRLRQARDNR